MIHSFYNGISYCLDGGIGIGVSVCIPELFQVYRFADIHTGRHAVNERFAFGQHVETTGEREGDDRQAEVQRNLECSPFESSYFAVKGTCSLREDDGADATYELFLHLLEALQRRLGVAAVNEDMSGGHP